MSKKSFLFLFMAIFIRNGYAHNVDTKGMIKTKGLPTVISEAGAILVLPALIGQGYPFVTVKIIDILIGFINSVGLINTSTVKLSTFQIKALVGENLTDEEFKLSLQQYLILKSELRTRLRVPEFRDNSLLDGAMLLIKDSMNPLNELKTIIKNAENITHFQNDQNRLASYIELSIATLGQKFYKENEFLIQGILYLEIFSNPTIKH